MINQTKRIILTVAVIIVFSFCAIVIVVYAAGYKIDIENRNISKTALIDINVNPNDSDVFLNGEIVGKGSQTIRNLNSGDNLLEVRKAGYTPFSKEVITKAGDVAVVPEVDLFLKEPVIKEYDKGLSLSSLESLSDSEGLSSVNGEVRLNGELITRLSQDVFGLSWFPNRQYVSFTNSGKLVVVRTDGSNLQELLDKDSQSPAAFTNSGKSVLYENKGKIYEAQIR